MDATDDSSSSSGSKGESRHDSPLAPPMAVDDPSHQHPHQTISDDANLERFCRELDAPAGPPLMPDDPIRLRSDSGDEFVVPARLLWHSKLFRMLLDPAFGWKEYWERSIDLEGIETKHLKRVIEYLEHKESHLNVRLDSFAMQSSSNIDATAASDFEFKVDDGEAVELMVVADFLGV